MVSFKPIGTEGFSEGLLATVGGSLATILAIIFSLALIPIQHFSERYTIEILKEFKNDIIVKVVFIIIAYSSLFAIFFLSFSSSLTLIFRLELFFSMFLCFYLLYLFYFYLFDVLDVRKLVEGKTNLIIKKLSSPKNPANDPNANSAVKDLDISEQVVLKSIERNETDIARDAIVSVTKLLYFITGAPKDSSRTSVLNRILILYIRALYCAMRYDNQTKYYLVYIVRDLVQFRGKNSAFNKEYFDEIMRFLYNINKTIVDKGDIDLFKAQLDYYSSSLEKDSQFEKELYDLFFAVGSYATCQKERKSFVKAIMTNVPIDSSIHWLNKNLANFDISFLSRQYVKILDLNRYVIDGFADMRSCINKYYILCLTYSLHTLGQTWSIGIPAPNDMKDFYIFIEEFQSHKTELQKACNDLKGEASDWSEIIKPKDKTGEISIELKTGSAISSEKKRIETSDAFANTLNWIEGINLKLEETKQRILQSLPLDPEKIYKCIEDIKSNYSQKTIVKRIVKSRNYDETKDHDKEFLHIGIKNLIDRIWFTAPDYYPMFSELGDSIAIGEENFLLDKIRENSATHYVDEISYDSIKSSIQQLAAGGLDPSALFAPIDFFVQMHEWKTGLPGNLAMALLYDSGRTYFVFSETKKLELFWSNKYVNLISFAIVDETFGEWITKPSEINEALTVKIEEEAIEKDKVSILVKSDFRFEVKRKNSALLVSKRT